MYITFHGAARTTTGSMHLLEVNGHEILLDCGLYQGKRKEAFERNRHLPFDARDVTCCVLSHAHIDHSGNLPILVKKDYGGRIHTTAATRDLCDIMLMDSAHLQEMDVEYVNKKRLRLGKHPFEPLYRQEDIPRVMERFDQLPYETPAEVVPGVTVTFHDAGHILGSAITTLDINENGTRRRLLFTGDLGRWGMPILRDPVVAHDVDLLITESTYGDRLHPSSEDVKTQLSDLCRKVTRRKSKLLIPAFSVGRTQEMLYLFHEMWKQGRLCDMPVYVDSPLSSRATKVYDDHPECYDKEMLAMIRRHEDPFTMERVTYTASVEESKQINDTPGPMIILSASGMCEGGRILHHLKNTIEDPDNIIVFVGYQAENTLGRRIVKNEKPIRIFGEEYELRAEVRSIQALSAHADRTELLRYFGEMGGKVGQAFVVHGEPDQAEPFADALRETGMEHVLVPEMGQRVRV